MNPPAYRVWLGWRAGRTPGRWRQFLDHLSRTFVPATWQVMRGFGLLAYMPSVLREAKPDDLPDETALLVYSSQEHYKRAFGTVAGRAYALLHGAVFESQAPLSSRSVWASPWPAAPDPKLPASVWPAAPEGPVFTDPTSTVIYLVLRHPSDQPGADKVYAALGPVVGEAVICQVPALSFVWLATRGERLAREVVTHILGASTDWTAEAVHDGTPSTCELDSFAPVQHEVALHADQTLHFAVRT